MVGQALAINIWDLPGRSDWDWLRRTSVRQVSVLHGILKGLSRLPNGGFTKNGYMHTCIRYCKLNCITQVQVLKTEKSQMDSPSKQARLIGLEGARSPPFEGSLISCG